jgi:hypothetical protein
MVIFRYVPKGKEAPPIPSFNTFAHTVDPYVLGAETIGKVSKEPIRQRLSAIYEGRLVGKDVQAHEGMRVVHTNCPNKGCGRITEVLMVRTVDNSRSGGACRVEWDAGDRNRLRESEDHLVTREGYNTGSQGLYALAAVALSRRDSSALTSHQDVAIVAAKKALQVGKHVQPMIGVISDTQISCQ